MANCCDFAMSFVGSEESIQKLLERFNLNDVDLLNIPGQDVSSFLNCSEATISTFDNQEIVLEGYCAWSVENCFLNPGNLFNLNSVSKELLLLITVKSREIGMTFSEHYLLKDGELLLDECTNFEFDDFFDDELNLKPEMERAWDKFLEL